MQTVNCIFFVKICLLREQIKLACETLHYILNIMPKGQALSRYEDLFLEGLVHSQNQVKELIISQVRKSIFLLQYYNKYRTFFKT